MFDFIKKIFHKKQVIIVTIGNTCPKCNQFGLFKIDDGFECQECLTCFDKNMVELC